MKPPSSSPVASLCTIRIQSLVIVPTTRRALRFRELSQQHDTKTRPYPLATAHALPDGSLGAGNIAVQAHQAPPRGSPDTVAVWCEILIRLSGTVWLSCTKGEDAAQSRITSSSQPVLSSPQNFVRRIQSSRFFNVPIPTISYSRLNQAR